nr:immunoglobulin light chain junction region [Macaca mulatta]
CEAWNNSLSGPVF